MTFFIGGTGTCAPVNCPHIGPVRFWAERGLICIEDARDNSYKTESVIEILYRMKGLQDMLNNRNHQFRNANIKIKAFDVSLRRDKLQRFLEDMIPVVRQAQEQGTPDEHMRRGTKDESRRRLASIPVGFSDFTL